MKKKLAAILSGVMVLTFGMTSVFAAYSPSTTDEGAAAVADAFESVFADVDASDYAIGSDDAATVTVNDEYYYITVADTSDLVDGQTYYITVDGVAVEAVYDEASGAFLVSVDDITIDDTTATVAVEIYSDPAADEDEEDPEEESEDTEEEPEDTEDPEEESEDTEADNSEADANSSEADADGSGSGSNGSNTSDKTGAAAALPLMAVAALAGVVVCGKKVKFYE